MNRTRPVLFGVACTVLMLSGCAQDMHYTIGAPVLDSRFGRAVKRAREMQVIRPDGVAVNDEGYSGKAAQGAMERLDAPAKHATPVQLAPVLDLGKASK
jgi:hypothetical protein